MSEFFIGLIENAVLLDFTVPGTVNSKSGTGNLQVNLQNKNTKLLSLKKHAKAGFPEKNQLPSSTHGDTKGDSVNKNIHVPSLNTEPYQQMYNDNGLSKRHQTSRKTISLAKQFQSHDKVAIVKDNWKFVSPDFKTKGKLSA